MSHMEDSDKVGAVEKVGSASKSNGIEEQIDPVVRVPPDKEHFDGLMQQGTERAPAAVSTAPTESVPPMEQLSDISKKVQGISQASPDTIIAQASDVIKQIESVKSKLSTPDLKIKGSVQTLMEHKLTHIDESLKVMLNRAGIEYKPQPIAATSNLASPIEKFIGMLTHGQHQLQKIGDEVSMLGKTNASISPANMLAIQIKMGYVQQEIELFTNVLNKSLESIKTIMNVQI